MLTIKKLKVYEYYKGDADSFARAGKRHKATIDDSDFYIIANLIQDIKMIDKGLASKSYTDAVLDSVSMNCDDDETIQYLNKLAHILP